MGTPEEIAAVVSFLAGPEGGWANAQEVRVNGGFAGFPGASGPHPHPHHPRRAGGAGQAVCTVGPGAPLMVTRRMVSCNEASHISCFVSLYAYQHERSVPCSFAGLSARWRWCSSRRPRPLPISA
nr:hypothetical protein [Nitratidesulfovibrio sp. HK-II]